MGIGRRAVLLLALGLCVGLAACGAGGTAVTTEIPKATSTPSRTLATSVNQFIGTWHGIKADGMYEHFTADGILQTATTLEGLAKPDAESTYKFEGTRLTIKELSTPGLPPCGPREGIYEVELLANGGILLRRIQDGCSQRGRTMAQEHERVR